jgi:ketosteroid isomerase-like protein
MTSKSSIEELLRSTYAARVRGDLDGTMAAFADDVVYEFNGRGTGVPSLSSQVHGKAALRPVMQELIHNFRFSDWRLVSLLVDGDQASLHWRALVTFPHGGKSAEFNVFDLITFRNGKFVKFHQSTDTALVVAMTAP